jgi:excisionase family DNA binding protein
MRNVPNSSPTNMPRSGRPLLKTAEAAQYLGLAKNTLEKMRIHGRRGDNAPRFVRLGSAVRYDPDELDAHIARNSATSTSEYDPSDRT